MKKERWLLLPLLCLSGALSSCDSGALSSCDDDSLEQVQIDFGTIEYVDNEISNTSHLKEISYSKFASFVEGKKKNFIILLHDSNSLCECWASFHEIVANWVIKRNMLVYYLDYQNVGSNDLYGLPYYEGSETIGIFEEGELKYFNSNVDEESDFASSYNGFSYWMHQRVTYPRFYYLSKDQLDALYNGLEGFTIYFARSGCNDCSYLERYSLHEYLSSHQEGSNAYVLDCDVEGICYYNGTIYSTNENASEDAQKAYAQWTSFKKEYGLAYDESNPAGWDNGYVPTLFHVQPQGDGSKIGDVIDASGVFFNDTLDKEDLTVTDSYFTEDRLEIEALSYLDESNVDKKVLLGESISNENIDSSSWSNEQQKVLQDPILYAFLDWAIS